MSQMQLQTQRVRRGRHHHRHQSAEPCECLRPVIRVFGLLTSFGKLKCPGIHAREMKLLGAQVTPRLEIMPITIWGYDDACA